MADNKLLSQLQIDRAGVTERGTTKFTFFIGAIITSTGVMALFLFQSPDSAPLAHPFETVSPEVIPTAPIRQQDGPIAASQAGRQLLDASGYVVAMNIATVSSKAVGRIDEVLVEEGMVVKKGDVLARLDSTSQRIQLDLAKAKHESAKAAYRESENRLREAASLLDRTRELFSRGAVSMELLETADIRNEAAKAELQRYEANIEIAQQEVLLQAQYVSDTIITAPFEGIVTQKTAQPGEIISPSTSGSGFTRTGICTIVDMQSLQVEVDVNESFINRVREGQRAEATLDAYPDWKLPAVVSAIVPAANRQKATIKVRLKFMELDPRVLPDMGIKVSFFEEMESSQ